MSEIVSVINGRIFIRMDEKSPDLHPVTTEYAIRLAGELGTAIQAANDYYCKQLLARDMPAGREFQAKLRVDLRDSYGDTYYYKGEYVTVFKRVAMPGTAESVLKYPYAIGTFHVDAAAFDPL